MQRARNRSSEPVTVGPFLLSAPIAHGGMASVHLGVLAHDGRRVLALKKLHPHLVDDDHFMKMLLDEAAIASAVRHPNVVRAHGGQVIDRDNTFVVMDYLPGISLGEAMKQTRRGLPPRLVVAIMAGVLRGLHAAHEARDSRGNPLEIVHRDVSPQNIMIGLDGVPRILDFGIAKAARRMQSTRRGEVKGKLAYMAPEQLREEAVDRRADIHAAGVVLWEALVGCPLFLTENEGATVTRILHGCSAGPSRFVPEIPPALDALIIRALELDPDDRFQTAAKMADALDAVFAAKPVSPRELATWMSRLGFASISHEATLQAELQRLAGRPRFDEPTVRTHARPQRATAPSMRYAVAVVSMSIAVASAFLGYASANALFAG